MLLLLSRMTPCSNPPPPPHCKHNTRHATVSITFDPGAPSWGQDRQNHDPGVIRQSAALSRTTGGKWKIFYLFFFYSEFRRFDFWDQTSGETFMAVRTSPEKNSRIYKNSHVLNKLNILNKNKSSESTWMNVSVRWTSGKTPKTQNNLII